MATPFNQIGHDQLESGWFLRIIDVFNLYISHEMDHDSGASRLLLPLNLMLQLH